MKEFSPSWKGSKSPRKQRKYRAEMPLHLRSHLMQVHLSRELRKKYGKRCVPVRVGDKVAVMRGQFRKKEGLVERVDRKNVRVFVAGVAIQKRDGANVAVPLQPSCLLILELNVTDKKRKEKFEVKKYD